ncbi:MAG: HypC/HybG/HupF family hydrogenase formation chaperone [Lachnospiraceae bacterium]|nr:HypC/HybG/HupF family hydrogenase formation chaperone [Lachnospiraceae bacterium]
MCVATSGEVLKVENGIAEVDFQGNIVRAAAGLTEVSPGDYVLVHAGVIIQKVTKQDNDIMTQLLAEMEDAARG